MPKTKNKQLTIAVDLDDVLAANAEGFVKFSNERWGTHLRPEEFHEDLETLWGVGHDSVNKRIIEFCESEIVRDYGYFAEASPVLARLKTDYHLVLVTSRRKLLAQATKDWVDTHLPDMFEAIHHAGIFDEAHTGAHKRTKAEILQEIGADCLIDDQLKHCIAAAKAGLQTLLFGDYQWNKANTLSPGVKRVKDWPEVEAYFYEAN